MKHISDAFGMATDKKIVRFTAPELPESEVAFTQKPGAWQPVQRRDNKLL